MPLEMKTEHICRKSRDCRRGSCAADGRQFAGAAIANRRVVRSQALRAGIKPLEQDIEDAIRRRTGRRIHKLEVKTSGEGVLVRGCAPSYYVGQLALCGVWDVTGRAGAIEVQLEVQVPASIDSEP
jgi:hypothetical protein